MSVTFESARRVLVCSAASLVFAALMVSAAVPVLPVA